MLVNSPVENALAFLTKQAGLSYVVLDAKTVRITPVPKWLFGRRVSSRLQGEFVKRRRV